MSNMSYCMFENTRSDLQECYDTICESIDAGKTLSKTYQNQSKLLLGICQNCAKISQGFMTIMMKKITTKDYE